MHKASRGTNAENTIKPVMPQPYTSAPSAVDVIATPTAATHTRVGSYTIPTGQLESEAQFPRAPRTVFEAQVALVRHGISPGVIDGIFGPQTSAALAAFQSKHKLRVTGQLDAQTKAVLKLDAPPLTNYILTAEDLARLQPLSPTLLGKSRQSALEYESALELVAERTFSHPNMIRALNPNIDWDRVQPGTSVVVPNVSYPTGPAKAAFVRISLAGRWLAAYDHDTNLIAYFPCSIARHARKRPVGELRVTAIVPNPNYTFDPANFPDSAEARALGQKLILPPGPNNPVGTAWIGLDKPGYGIHGTPAPERIGRPESLGCFRLANWNAEYLLRLVWIGMPVYVEP
ncbi:MAG: L,D-transpeptidase [Verrucomicrobiae bacterium]|nr:L,D-transpeptidase [Verrucomicrobiae bacterium]